MNIETKKQPQITKVQLEKNCLLETITSQDVNHEDFKIDINVKIEKPAKKYPFKLDPFQKAAIWSVEKNVSVLVAAHTSAGKTAVAEYVIAKCLQKNQRVIYTSPIKALSNQKYRELKKEFGQVGLVTGDITIEENQTCLVMTTEILRNMLFRSNEVAKETAWIIFDEAHYIKDKDRGVIWEETIILAPKNVRYCLLSATAPNASELAQWILQVKKLDSINVIYTDKRPIPLEYYAYMPGQKCLHLVKNKKGNFNMKNLEKLGNLSNHRNDVVLKKKKRSPSKLKDIKKLIKMIVKKKYYPVIIFAFSKKEVEILAKTISQTINLLNKDEQQQQKSFFETIRNSLSEEDRNLPQITQIYDILKAGVGLHHGGMLPILKETVEIFFQTGLVKVLVSTETFSMGVNMPARTVVFSSVEKWDGEQFRNLNGAEFVQMSGRAGRRGRDAKGLVITLLDNNIDIKQYTHMLKSGSKLDPLISQFDISYNMLLNIQMMEGFKTEDMLKSSFKQFQHDIQKLKQNRVIKDWKRKVDQLEKYFDKIKIKFNLLIELYYWKQKRLDIQQQIRQILVEPLIILPYLNIGRLIFVEGCGWVPFINFNSNQDQIHLDILVNVNYSKSRKFKKKVRCNCNDCLSEDNLTELKEPQIITVRLQDVMQVSQVVLKMPNNLVKLQNRFKSIETVKKVIYKFKHDVILMRLITDMPISNEKLKEEALTLKIEQENLDKKLVEVKQKYLEEFKKSGINVIIFGDLDTIEEIFQDKFENSEIFFRENVLDDMFQLEDITQESFNQRISYFRKKEEKSFDYLMKFALKMFQLRDQNQQNLQMILNEKMEKMSNVLKTLDFIDDNAVVQNKGRVASFIFGSDEILITELLLSGKLPELDSKQLAIIFSLFVNEQKQNEKIRTKLKDEKVFEMFNEIKKTVKYLFGISKDQELTELSEEEVLDKINTSLFDIISKWYDGESFKSICEITDAYEGSIIRSIKRLYELLSRMKECVNSIGNKDLVEKFDQAAEKLHRGIVFKASLYINQSR